MVVVVIVIVVGVVLGVVVGVAVGGCQWFIGFVCGCRFCCLTLCGIKSSYSISKLHRNHLGGYNTSFPAPQTLIKKSGETFTAFVSLKASMSLPSNKILKKPHKKLFFLVEPSRKIFYMVKKMHQRQK